MAGRNEGEKNKRIQRVSDQTKRQGPDRLEGGQGAAVGRQMRREGRYRSHACAGPGTGNEMAKQAMDELRSDQETSREGTKSGGAQHKGARELKRPARSGIVGGANKNSEEAGRRAKTSGARREVARTEKTSNAGRQSGGKDSPKREQRRTGVTGKGELGERGPRTKMSRTERER
uniref:Uncharacterized protein n=1 Tax=Knipowitschia caucasica TaxID=637954 RepID=A0AAV2J3P8_KNICA